MDVTRDYEIVCLSIVSTSTTTTPPAATTATNQMVNVQLQQQQQLHQQAAAMTAINQNQNHNRNNQQQHQLSRPNSLFGPEKEPVYFNINLIGAPPEVEQLVDHIKAVAEQFLYHYKTFPIVLPNSLSGNPSTSSTTTTTTTNRKFRPINLRDLFVPPPFDELDAVATDGTGEPKRLTNTQLKSVRDRGEFEVQSLHFPGQVHRWRLSQLLQKGSERTQDSLLSDLALAARFLIVTARTRIFGHFLSIAHAARALLTGLLRFIDIFVGIPSLLAHNLEYKLREERCRYLIAELVCPAEYEDCLHSLCGFVRRQLRRATTEKFDVECESAQPIPYLFLTPKGQQIDLRLFSRDVIRKALPILVVILERETRGWFLHFRERLIAELREKKMTDHEIEEEVNEAVMKEYLQRVYSSILNHTDLVDLGEHIPQLLVQQAQSVVIMHKAVEKMQKELKRTKEEHRKYLINDYPVLSRVAPWIRTKLQTAETTKYTKLMWSPYEEAIRLCTKHNIPQTAYFLSRDMAFMKEREPVLLKELRNAKTPTRSFQWSCRIWSPKSWIIRRNFQGQSETIPTVICQQATSIVTPRSDPSQPVFLIERETIRTTSTRWPFWRLLNLIQRIWCWTWNMMFLLGVIVPWDSPFSIRALFSIKPFMSDLELSQVNGTLFPRKTSITQTLPSRLIELWRHISKARTHFETEPDTGFIGKGLTRHLNRLWNYFIKGFCGTLMIVFLFPIICVTISVCSILFALTAPLWIPVFAVCLHIYMILIYDLDCPNINTSANINNNNNANTNNNKNKAHRRYCILFQVLFWNILLQGLCQPIAAILVATILCPLAATSIFIVGIIRYWIRRLWDAITFYSFIKKCGRVPAGDSIAVKRIAGPGLTLDYYFIIKPEQALAAFEAKMESDELQAFQKSMEQLILQPQKDFHQFVEACFGPFSASLSKSVGPYRALETEGKDLMSSLHEKLDKRRRDLQIGLPTIIKTKIKLNTMDLKIAMQQAAHLLEKFYPEHVMRRLSMTEEEYWDSKGLQVGDWAGLAGLMYTDIFSLDFLTPLSDIDTHFKLVAHSQLDLSRYTEMVQNSIDIMGENGPDLLGNVYAPRGNIQIHSPFLEVSAFNPRSRITLNFRKAEKRNDTTTGLTTPRVHLHRTSTLTKKTEKLLWRPWKRKNGGRNGGEKLLIPLPIPHPAHIAISIHNRDSEHPIPLDSDICWDILRAIEDCHGDIQANIGFVSRVRGGEGMRNSLDECDSSVYSLDSHESQGSSNGTRDSMAAVGGTETLPCGAREVCTTVTQQTNTVHHTPSTNSFHWTLSNWGAAAAHAARRRNNSGGTVRVDLASPEDISLDTNDSTRVVFSAYGTTV